jgi:hypothetical protein
VDLGPTRGPRASEIRKPSDGKGQGEPVNDVLRPIENASAANSAIQVTLSAETKAEIQVGAKGFESSQGFSSTLQKPCQSPGDGRIEFDNTIDECT